MHRLVLVAKQRDADAGRAVQHGVLQRVGPAQLLQHFLRDQFGFYRRFGGPRLQPLQHQHKFVAAQAGHRVAGPHTGGDALGHQGQQPVTPFVTQGVVDALEVVQVQKQQGPVSAFAGTLGDGALQAVHQQAPVGQAGELVVERQALDLGFGPLLRRDVAPDAPVARKLALLVKDGLSADGHPHPLARGLAALDLKVVEHLVGLQLGTVFPP